MCEVFFFGTARSTPSQMSVKMPGMLRDIAGIDMVAAGYIEFDRCRSRDPDEVWKAPKLGAASRESIENAAKVCGVAMVYAMR